MDNEAISIVRQYILEHLDKSDSAPDFTVYTVWKAKALQNWKFVLAAPSIGVLFEVTYNGDRKEWYVDIYEKTDNVVFAEDIHPAFYHDGIKPPVQQPSAAERKQRQ